MNTPQNVPEMVQGEGTVSGIQRRPPVQPHHHGTVTGYTNGCRCPSCRSANTTKAAIYRRRRAYGQKMPTDRVPITEPQRILRELYAAGYTDTQLARLCGLTNQQTNRIRQRGSWVTRETAERIAHGAEMAVRVPPRDLLAERYVDATGARRRVKALMTQGWPVEDLGRRLGHSGGYLSPLLYSSRQITPALEQTVRDLYEQLWSTPGPSSSTRQRSTKRGWPPPLFWDDDRIDDPTYDGEAIYRRERAQMTNWGNSPSSRADLRASDADAVAELTEKGLSAREISDRLGFSERRVVRLRGLRDTATRTESSHPVRTLDDMERQAS